MTKKDKQLIIQDLGMRVLHKVKVLVNGSIKTLTDIYSDRGLGFDDSQIFYGWKTFDMKPLLRPINSMSEEELREYERIYTESGLRSELYLWLISHHFDILDLIPKGLAEKASPELYR